MNQKISKISKCLEEIVASFSQLNEVDGILLSGSRAGTYYDERSDIDLYVYVSHMIPIEKRIEITNQFSDDMETNNQFWETEDDGHIRDLGIGIDIIYRDYNWVKGELERVVDKCIASVGYTTCIWYNFTTSKILFDRDGRLKSLQKKYDVPYPHQLKQNIINKNYPILKNRIGSYYHQIEKALQRGDVISVNHRVAAFLASYFDILFAVNEMPHPGEKKLMDIVRRECRFIPNDFEQNIQTILKIDNNVVDEIEQLIENLNYILKQEKLLFY